MGIKLSELYGKDRDGRFAGCRKCGCKHAIPGEKPGTRVCRHCGAQILGLAPKARQIADNAGIVCPNCQGRTEVIRTTLKRNRIHRRRECQLCGKRCNTVEVVRNGM